MVLLYTYLLAAGVSAKCYEATTAHPLPDLDPQDSVLKNAFASVTTAIDAIAAASLFDATSFSIEITSSKHSLWSKHHTARERNASRPDIPEVNGDALYRIASITKTFTVLGILQQHDAGNLSLDDPVNKYIKELKEDQDGTLPWKDITLRSLASQLSGIPREFAQGDIINEGYGELRPENIGLPPVSREGLIGCDEYSNYQTPCTAKDLLKAVKSQRPLFAPNMKSTYSNVAFNLLGLVIERVTGQPYRSYISDAIFKPLSMSKSTLSLPDDSAGVIPLDPQYWYVDTGIQSPTGGIYSSTTDLSKFLRYVLTHYNAITTGVNWLNVGSGADGLHSFYGMPWEIFHTDRILNKSRRTVRFITKGGGLPGYFSKIVVVPEYDLGISILVAGESKLVNKLLNVVSQEVVRAAESVAINQLLKRYVGTYTSTNRTLNSSITLAADERGLVVEELISNGTDVLHSRLTSPYSNEWYAQVVPTLLYLDEKKQQGELWRVSIADERLEGSGDVWDDFCITDVDHPLYAGAALNEMIFWEKENGRYNRVELSAFRVNLTRTDREESKLAEEEEKFEL